MENAVKSLESLVLKLLLTHSSLLDEFCSIFQMASHVLNEPCSSSFVQDLPVEYSNLQGGRVPY